MKPVKALVLLLMTGCGADVRLLGAGASLDGWHGDPRYWRVEDGEIIGNNDGFPPLTENSFLTFQEPFADFVLDLDFKIRNGNSGIQFRSEELPDYAVRGYQGDISVASDGYLGILYEERGRGFLSAMMIPGVYDHVDLSGWNHYRIIADGSHIVLAINDFTSVDYTETDPNARRSGVIAVQLHVGPAMEIRFRDIRVVNQR